MAGVAGWHAVVVMEEEERRLRLDDRERARAVRVGSNTATRGWRMWQSRFNKEIDLGEIMRKEREEKTKKREKERRSQPLRPDWPGQEAEYGCLPDMPFNRPWMRGVYCHVLSCTVSISLPLCLLSPSPGYLPTYAGDIIS
jgi:hypothetical protein